MHNFTGLCQELGVELSSETKSGYLFGELINKAKDLGKVVILIDEYDKPLVENIYAPHIEEVRQVLENFHINIKASDEHLRFVFMTGVTKFTKVSVFSKLNNLRDITISESFATMYGYTQKEVGLYFSDRLNELADKNKVERTEYREKIQKWYNGFRFHEVAPKVYNPVSLGMFNNEGGRFSIFWFSTGSPSFIFYILKRQNVNFLDTIFQPIDGLTLDSFDVTNMMAAPHLLQAGYLTIDRVVQHMFGPAYYFRFPNIEIETAFEKHLVSSLSKCDLGVVTSEIMRLNIAFQVNDTDTLHHILKSHIAAMPYANLSHMEENYQNIIYSIFRLLGAEIHNEVHLNNGRIDTVIVNRNHIYIFEFKNRPTGQSCHCSDQRKGLRHTPPKRQQTHYADWY